jgi:hypothetical protein
MVLSWLTATNNSGRFIFSINRRRHTASFIVPTDDGSETGKPRAGVEFVLSIPVKGMERIVTDVGGTSGKWGSKFTVDHDNEGEEGESGATASTVDMSSLSNRQKKKLKRQQLATGVPGLVPVPFGYASDDDPTGNCFAVQGTCAHLKCRTYAVVSEPANVIDDDHHLVCASVVEAYVHTSYWDKKLFRPACGVPPYLTFFGAQQFGYVSCCGE